VHLLSGWKKACVSFEMEKNFSYIIIALAAGLALQLYLTGWQTRRFYSRLKVIRREGLTSIGLEGGIWSGRRYAVLVVDENLKILHAEKMSGMTIFSKLKPVPELVGLNTKDILDEERDFSVNKKIMKAFRNAARELLKHGSEASSTIEDKQIKSVKVKG